LPGSVPLALGGICTDQLPGAQGIPDWRHRTADHVVLFWAYLSIPLQYYWLGIHWYGMFIIFIPVYIFLFVPMRMVLIGETQGFLKAAASLQWG
jgi:predicted CDP-diglyceride synthetase/phosphatidate cytidylyltransferase